MSKILMLFLWISGLYLLIGVGYYVYLLRLGNWDFNGISPTAIFIWPVGLSVGLY